MRTTPPPEGAPRAAPEETKDTFRAVFEGSLTAMLLTDDDRRCVDANRPVCRLLRRSREDLLSRRIDDLTPPAARPGLADQWEAFLRQGSQAACSDLLLADGSTLAVEFSATANIHPGRHLWILMGAPRRRRTVAASGRSEASGAPPAASAPPPCGSPLSAREQEVLGLLAMGASGAEIAERLFISPATVRTHIGNAMEKLGARTRAHAIALALQRGAIAL